MTEIKDIFIVVAAVTFVIAVIIMILSYRGPFGGNTAKRRRIPSPLLLAITIVWGSL